MFQPAVVYGNNVPILKRRAVCRTNVPFMANGVSVAINGVPFTTNDVPFVTNHTSFTSNHMPFGLKNT